MKKIFAIFAFLTLIVAGRLCAQTYYFDISITDNNPQTTDYFEVGCTAYPINSGPIGPLGVTTYNNITATSPIVLTGLSCNFTGITPPDPDLRNFIYFRVWVRKNGTILRYCDSEWFSYSSSGWTSAQQLTFSF